ncbi:MAG TPA: sigma-70 family RNA polymerase sigma factor [Phototrophicaceae bacterium]|nr:sigma-70 family RNA polymerase sigma factor [Phototrophicaceae bacterium]
MAHWYPFMNPVPETALLRRIQAGDEGALMTLHAQYAALVYSVAYRVLNDRMAAEEVTQDTFLRLWNKSVLYDPAKGRFVTWLLTMTRRLAIDHFRHQQRREPQTGLLFMDDDPGLWENTLMADSSSDLRRTLQSAIDQLQPEQRELIELAYFYGMTHSDIAAQLQLPLGTVKTRLRVGMQKLRQVWLGETPVKPGSDDLT